MLKSYGATFTAPMILATLAGDKSMTRRVIEKIDHFKHIQPGDEIYVKECWRIVGWDLDDGDMQIQYKADGFVNSEWVRIPEDEDWDGEKFEHYIIQCADDAQKAGVEYDAEGLYHWEAEEAPTRWRSGMIMPAWAARIRRTVIRTWTENVQEITAEDCLKEGIFLHPQSWIPPKVVAMKIFKELWDSINAKRGYDWDQNPRVRVIEWRNE